MKTRKKPSAPVMDIEWVVTPAQEAGTITEDVRDGREGVARRRRRYRLHPLEMMAKSGTLTPAQCQAGLALHEAYCKTLMGPPAIREIVVDATTDYDALAVKRCDLLTSLAKMMQPVTAEQKRVVWHVCCEGLAIRNGLAKDGHQARAYVRELGGALDAMAVR